MTTTDASFNAEPGSGPPSMAAPIIEAAPLAMVEVEGPDHLVCFVNPAFCRLLDRTQEELLGKPFADIVRQGDRCVPLLDRIYQTGEFETHVELDHSASTPAYWLYAMWPARGAGARPERVVIQLTKAADPNLTLPAMNEALLISGLRQHELRVAAEQANAKLAAEIAERKAAVAALSAANAELKIAQAVAERASQAKDGFLATLSHELRTPLAPVLITAAALREDERLPPDVRDELGMIERNIALEARLIDDLLDLTRIAHGKLQLRLLPYDVATLISYALEIVRPDAQVKQIAIETTFNAHPGELLGDPTRLQQVIWNLLRNAVRYTPAGGRISLVTRDVPGSDGKARLQIEISDTGIGIEPAKLERIFVAFDQGGAADNRRSGGLGLGLSIARSVVEMHGGQIVARSGGLNHGSTFLVELPRTEVASVDAQPAEPAGACAPSADLLARKPAPLRLLVVEDHAATLEAVSRLLRRDGHTVVSALNVADALAAARTGAFDCVISDLGLPDGSGLEMMSQLRDGHGLRGIALSGYGMETDLALSRDAGFVAHLTKPVALADLRSVIASIQHQTSDAPAPPDGPDRVSRPDHVPAPPED